MKAKQPSASARDRTEGSPERQAVYPRAILGRATWIWVLLTTLLLTGSRYQTGALLHTSPQAVRLKVGETTAVDLTLTDVQGLYGAEIHLRFDPEALRVIDAVPDTEGVQIEPGTFPAPDFVVHNEANNDIGTIDYVITQLPPSQPGEGSGMVARITFEGIKPSVSSLQFERFLLADTIGGNIDALAQDGQITVQSRSVWMLYATLGATLALAIGGIGYLVARTTVRRRK
jgi:hypothetical protein